MNLNKLEEIARKIHELRVKHSQLHWTMYTTGFDFGIKEAYQKMMEAYQDKGSYEQILELLELDLDPINKRRVEIMVKSFKPYHLSEELNEINLAMKTKVNELMKIINTFRFTFEGRSVTSVDINQILSSDPDRKRRKAAYFARNQINQPLIDAGFIDLVNLRKEYARLYGAENFVTYRLEENDLDKNTFDAWIPQLQELLPKMNEVRIRYAQEYLKDDSIMPWDEQYISGSIAPSLNAHVDMSNFYANIKEFVQVFGIDISKFNITYDVFPRANKSEWGYNFPIEKGKDSRVLANVKNKYHEYNVLLHETGHAIHSFLLDPEEIILNSGVSGIINEGIANLFGSFMYEKAFFQRFFQEHDKVEEEFRKLKEYKRLTGLRAIQRIFFDHSLYLNPIETLEDIYELYWKIQREAFHEEPFGQDPPWAYTIHYTSHPIYFHNYFMGDVTCEMLASTFVSKFGAKPLEKPEDFGQFIIEEVIQPSGLYTFNELFKRISGEEFSLKYMVG